MVFGVEQPDEVARVGQRVHAGMPALRRGFGVRELYVQNAGRACDEWLCAPGVYAAHDTKSTTDTNARQRHSKNFGVRNFAETGVLETRGLALDILRSNRLGTKLGDRRRIGLAAPALGF